MIKFFRPKRKDLVATGKTTKYFKYAIGEIVLVVIGILIALQINTWNETKKDEHVEKVYMQNLLEDLNSDVAIYDNYAKNNKIIYNLVDSLVLHLKSKNRIHRVNDLSYWSRMLTAKWIMVYPTERTYEQMKSSGDLRLIKNRNVADSMSYYYNSLSILNTYNEAGLVWATDYVKYMGEIFDAEISLKILKERKPQQIRGQSLLTNDPITLNKLMNSAQYFYGALKLAEETTAVKSKEAEELIELIKNDYAL